MLIARYSLVARSLGAVVDPFCGQKMCENFARWRAIFPANSKEAICTFEGEIKLTHYEVYNQELFLNCVHVIVIVLQNL